jgi:hypothetical protein
MHCGLDKNRKKKVVKFLLKNLRKKIAFHHTIFLIMPFLQLKFVIKKSVIRF